MTTQTTAPGPGIYYDVPDAEYRAWPYVSQSTLGLFRDPDLCQLEIKDRIEHPRGPTDEMELGTLFERTVNGEDVQGNVKLLPPEIKARRGAAWNALHDDDPSINWLPKSEFDKHMESIVVARAMAEHVHAHPFAGKVIAGATKSVAFVADLTFDGQSGQPVTHRVKGLLDYWNEEYGVIADLKSTVAGGPRSIGRSIHKYAYDIQSAVYTDAMRQLTGRDDIEFVFLFCRTIRPYVVSPYHGHHTASNDGELLAIGRIYYQKCLEEYAECVRSGVWKSYHDSDPDGASRNILTAVMPNYYGSE
jgi:hypothetical protein